VYILLSTHATRYDHVVRGGIEYSDLSLRVTEERVLCDDVSPQSRDTRPLQWHELALSLGMIAFLCARHALFVRETI